MARGKSTYTFTIENPVIADNMIKQFLQANNFKFVQKNGMAAFQKGDGMITAKKFFEYYFNGNTLTIYAYVYKLHKPVLLDDEYYLCIPKNELKSILYPLLNQLEQLQNGAMQNGQAPIQGYENNVHDPMQGYANNEHYNQYSNPTYVAENKHYKTLAIIGFILSILGLLTSCLGRTLSLYVILMIFFMAYYGLKSKLRGLSIATIVIGIIDLLLFLAILILGINA